MKLDSLMVVEVRTPVKLLDIMDNASDPLHTVISNQRSLFSERLLLPKCRTSRDRVRSSAIWEELGVELLLLLRVQRNQMRWLGHLVRMPLDASLVRC
ncbi:hypothetical protein D4764_04G0013620 [Takifugu flavidus]|uniref:Uncharacterized protein n=1 Tax=Takifugu flavidus TaxID=433684 RepID=A0A5C6N6J9_9TELE|nr:hypothetical protein D4764_04G0013620 [Takifugu flavidus]